MFVSLRTFAPLSSIVVLTAETDCAALSAPRIARAVSAFIIVKVIKLNVDEYRDI